MPPKQNLKLPPGHKKKKNRGGTLDIMGWDSVGRSGERKQWSRLKP